MNDHEAQRIAAALHELRPDWPTSSLLTLIRKHLIDKPRRDVSVALAWVACETNSATPARVLEMGPWWRAAGVEGNIAPRHPNPSTACRTCGGVVDRCGCENPTVRPESSDYTTHAAEARELLRAALTPAPTPEAALAAAREE